MEKVSKIEVRQAEEKDVEIVKNLIMETALWLAEKGSKQWSDIRTGEDEQNISEAIKLGEVYLALLTDGDEEIPAGLFTLRDIPNEWDQACWGPDESRDYYYLHRLTTNRDLAGNNIGGALLTKATEVGKAHNKKAIRLDCDAENTNLNEFYQDNGFDFVKSVYIPHLGDDIDDFNLYQKNI